MGAGMRARCRCRTIYSGTDDQYLHELLSSGANAGSILSCRYATGAKTWSCRTLSLYTHRAPFRCPDAVQLVTPVVRTVRAIYRPAADMLWPIGVRLSVRTGASSCSAIMATEFSETALPLSVTRTDRRRITGSDSRHPRADLVSSGSSSAVVRRCSSKSRNSGSPRRASNSFVIEPSDRSSMRVTAGKVDSAVPVGNSVIAMSL